MTNPTTPFSWQMPTSTDLVTDLPADFETFGQAVATSMADLLGGTTGQVLSKASNTDMDFSWVAQDDSNAIQNAIVDAKGDLIAATAADTPARLAVGTNGQVLTADSTAATGLAWASPSVATYVGVSVYKSAAQTISNLTATAITFNTEDFDTDGFHSTSTNTSRFTIPSNKAGKYLLTGNVNYLAGNVTGPRAAYIYKNGSVYNYHSQQAAVSPSPYGAIVKVSFILNLAVGDYIELFAFQGDGGNLDVAQNQSGTNVQMTYLGA